MQHTGIDDLIFDIPTLISSCSDWTPLVAGDVISTGTPEGVGFARKPPLWMKRNHPARAMMVDCQAATAEISRCFQCHGSSWYSWEAG